MTNKRKENMPDRSLPGLTTTALSTEDPLGGCSDKSATGSIQAFKLASKKTIIGTWNACGKRKELEHELQPYHWDIIGLSEVKWTGFGETTTEDGHKLWYSGDDTRHQHGVGFFITRK